MSGGPRSHRPSPEVGLSGACITEMDDEGNITDVFHLPVSRYQQLVTALFSGWVSNSNWTTPMHNMAESDWREFGKEDFKMIAKRICRYALEIERAEREVFDEEGGQQ